MTRSPSHRAVLAWTVGISLTLVASTAWAQIGGGGAPSGNRNQAPTTKLLPPVINPPREPESIGFMLMVWSVVILVVPAAATLFPTKRGHQD